MPPKRNNAEHVGCILSLRFAKAFENGVAQRVDVDDGAPDDSYTPWVVILMPMAWAQVLLQDRWDKID